MPGSQTSPGCWVRCTLRPAPRLVHLPSLSRRGRRPRAAGRAALPAPCLVDIPQLPLTLAVHQAELSGVVLDQRCALRDGHQGDAQGGCEGGAGRVGCAGGE